MSRRRVVHFTLACLQLRYSGPSGSVAQTRKPRRWDEFLSGPLDAAARKALIRSAATRSLLHRLNFRRDQTLTNCHSYHCVGELRYMTVAVGNVHLGYSVKPLEEGLATDVLDARIGKPLKQSWWHGGFIMKVPGAFRDVNNDKAYSTGCAVIVACVRLAPPRARYRMPIRLYWLEAAYSKAPGQRAGRCIFRQRPAGAAEAETCLEVVPNIIEEKRVEIRILAKPTKDRDAVNHVLNTLTPGICSYFCSVRRFCASRPNKPALRLSSKSLAKKCEHNQIRTVLDTLVFQKHEFLGGAEPRDAGVDDFRGPSGRCSECAPAPKKT